MANPSGVPLSVATQNEPNDECEADNEISDAALSCRQLFEEYLDSPHERIHTKSISQLQRRFLTWAGFLGVFAPVKASLDTRLADSPEVKALFTSMLRLLKRNLKRGIRRHSFVNQEDDDSPTTQPVEEDGAMVGITGAMDRLDRLAFIIRTTSRPKQDEVQRVLDSRLKREPDGFDEVIFALIKHRFPTEVAAPSLQTQLASSIIYRRNRLIHQAKHEAKLQAERDNPDCEYSDTAPTLPQNGVGDDAMQSGLLGNIPEDGEMQMDDAAQKTAADANMVIFVQGDTNAPLAGARHSTLMPKAAPSDTSSVYSNNPFLEAKYPAPPTVPRGQMQAICNLCCKPQPRETFIDKRRWRSHVNQDLKPYVCISEACGNIPPAFSRRRDWENHMQTTHDSHWIRYIHRPNRWFCPVKDQRICTEQEFGTQDELLRHMESCHPSKGIPSNQLIFLASNSKSTIPLQAGICPLCGKDELSIRHMGEDESSQRDKLTDPGRAETQPQPATDPAVAPKGRWGSLLSQAVAGVEARLGTMLAEDNLPKAAPSPTPSQQAKSPIIGPSRPDSANRNRTNDRLQEHLARAVAAKQAGIKSDGAADPAVDLANQKLASDKVTARESDLADRGPTMPLDPPSLQPESTSTASNYAAKDIIMAKHISHHLESLALWSLRWWDDDSGAPDDLSMVPSVDTKQLEIQEIYFSVPFGRNINFIGSPQLVADCVASIRLPRPSSPSSSIAVSAEKTPTQRQRNTLHGPSGIGKTEIALEAAYRLHETRPQCSIFWVSAQTQTTFIHGFRRIARLMGLPGADDPLCDVLELVKDALSQETAGEWLLLMDSVGGLFDPFDETNDSQLPSSPKGSIMSMRTRPRGLIENMRRAHIEVGPMSEAQSRRLFLQHGLDGDQDRDHDNVNPAVASSTTSSDTDAAAAWDFLLGALRGQPRFIKQVRTYIQRTNVPLEDYVKLLTHREASYKQLIEQLSEHFHKLKWTDISDRILCISLLSLDNITHERPIARKFLEHLCFYSYDYIPRALLQERHSAAAMVETVISDSPKGIMQLQVEALNILETYGLVKCNIDGDYLSIDRYYRIFMWKLLEITNTWTKIYHQTLKDMSDFFPDPSHDNMDKWEDYLPHAAAVISQYPEQDNANTSALEKLTFKMAKCKDLTGNFREAESMHRKALRLKEQTMGYADPRKQENLHHLGLNLFQQGKYEEAEQIHREELVLTTSILGPKHPFTLQTSNNLGVVLHKLGKYDEAESVYESIYNQRLETHGRLHPDTRNSLKNLGLVQWIRGKLKEAEESYREALGMLQEMQKTDQVVTEQLSIMENLSTIIRKRNRLEEAEKLQLEIVELKRAAFGAENPGTLVSVNDLACLLLEQERFDKAERAHRDVLQCRQKVLSSGHRDIIQSMGNLALTLRLARKYGEAEKIYREMIDLKRATFGPEHPSIRGDLHDLYLVLQKLGKLEEATLLQQEKLMAVAPETQSRSVRGPLTLYLDQ